MSIDRWMDQEDVAHIYNGISLSHERTNLSQFDIWNLEKLYWWTNLQGRNRDADVVNGLVDTVGEGEGGMNRNSSIDIYTLVKWVKSLSRVRPFATPWTIAHQAPPSMGFSRQEYWSGLLFPSPGALPNPGIETRSPALQADVLTSEPPGKPHIYTIMCKTDSWWEAAV